MRLLALAVTTFAAALAAGVGPAGATNECRGLMVCVPVAGPWVAVPVGGGALRPTVEYQLSCPRGYVVGGLDAELSDRGVDVAFLGRLGSPVNPGITTSRAVVFAGRSTGPPQRVASFRPHIGCVPATGGGGRIPTAVTRVFPPGQPTVRRVRTVRIAPGSSRVVQACRRGERLVGAAHAVGFYTGSPPGRDLVRSVSSARSAQAARVVVSVRAGSSVKRVRTVLQVGAVCAGGA